MGTLRDKGSPHLNFKAGIFWTFQLEPSKLSRNYIISSAYRTSKNNASVRGRRAESTRKITSYASACLKGMTNEDNVSWVSKRTGSKCFASLLWYCARAMQSKPWNILVNIVSSASKRGNICCESKNVFEKIQKHLLRPQEMLRARANRETFWEILKFTNISATMFPCLPRPLDNQKQDQNQWWLNETAKTTHQLAI